ncbi:unnamed protein product [Calypogeia fissa]
MTTYGTGSGVDILKRMQPGGSLDGTWVIFDVMHRCTGGWLTFSAHTYDHHLWALSMIFTCELKTQDPESQETAWRLMVDIAKRHGVREVTIKGFMANNAEAGWEVVRNVFFNGKPDPFRERSDLFHFKQSFVRHAKGGVPFEKREEHEIMWDRMRNAPTWFLLTVSKTRLQIGQRKADDAHVLDCMVGYSMETMGKLAEADKRCHGECSHAQLYWVRVGSRFYASFSRKPHRYTS